VSRTDTVLLGRLNETGPIRNVYLDSTNELVIAIIGKRGTGKSFSLGVLAEGLCTVSSDSSLGTTSGRKAAILFDTLNVFWTLGFPIDPESPAQAERFGAEIGQMSSWGISPGELDVSVWVPQGYRRDTESDLFNEFAIDVGELQIEDIADLIDVDPQGDLMGQLLTEAFQNLTISNVGISFENLILMIDDDHDIQDFYSAATIRALVQRLRSVSQLSVFSQNGTSLGSLLAPGHLSVIQLGSVPAHIRAVLANVLIRRIHAERAEAADLEKQLSLNMSLDDNQITAMREQLSRLIPPTWVLIDEAQNILPSDRSIKSTDAIVRYVREGRNYGLSLAVTTQQPTALDSRIMAQVDTIIAHQLTVAEDISHVRQNLKSQEPSEARLSRQDMNLSELLRSLGRGEALVTNTETARVFALQFRPRVTPHAGVGWMPE
jgi:uncharacterized protein